MATKREKGAQNEKEAAKIAYHNYRMVDRLDKIDTPYNENKDMFRFADLAAMNRNKPITLIQIKTNSFANKGYYNNKALLLQSIHVKCEVWVKKTTVNEPKWFFYRFNGVNFEKYLESSGLDIHDTGRELKIKKETTDFSEVSEVKK